MKIAHKSTHSTTFRIVPGESLSRPRQQSGSLRYSRLVFCSSFVKDFTNDPDADDTFPVSEEASQELRTYCCEECLDNAMHP